jgi:hypothetical protein
MAEALETGTDARSGRGQQGEAAAGRAAADRLSDGWPHISWVPQAPSEAWAHAAVGRLAELIRDQKAIFRASQRGSERGGSSLSARPYQGLLESLQNADDLDAHELRVAVRDRGRRELLIVHDGNRMRLDHVGAMVLPWLTTKAADAEASGRFGIGQATLRALGGPIEVHSAPFHFRMEDEGPVTCPPIQPIKHLYAPGQHETLLLVPLLPEVDPDALSDFLRGVGASGLLFLRSVRRVSLVDLTTGKRTVDLHLVEGERAEVRLRLGGSELVADRLELHAPSSGHSYTRYVVERPLSASQQRHHKATGPTTTLGVALAERGKGPGGLYDRLPLQIPSAFPFGLNAQFDPNSARSALLENSWNDLRFRDLGELVAAVALDRFVRNPASGWSAVPLAREASSEAGEWVNERLESVVSDAQRLIKDEVRIEVAGQARELSDLVYEETALEMLLVPDDLASLAPEDHVPLPLPARDPDGRWREVLEEFACSPKITTREALALLDRSDQELGERKPSWFVGMARAAIDTACFDTLLGKRSMLLADSRRIEPPRRADPRSLVSRVDPGSIAAALNLALPIHAAYQVGSDSARRVVAKLEQDGLLLESCDSADDALRLLARDRRSNAIRRVCVSDDQLLSLRDAFERLSEGEQRRLGPRVGRNIELRGYRYGSDGNREEVWVSPGEAYLPNAIDRESDSFATAADKTPGLSWIDSSYAKLLRRSGRRELGAQRFLGRLGVATAPRLTRPGNDRQVWRRDTRPASRIDEISRLEIQLREIRALPPPTRTHLLGDHWSPDLDAVTANIAADRNRKRRRRRAVALLGVLARPRTWENYADHQYARATWAYDGYWHDERQVVSTWLARAASEPWLPSATGALRAPSELALPTEANRLAHSSRKSAFLTKVDDQVLRSPALLALRLRRGPTATSLVARLRELREAPVHSGTEAEARTIYRLLALYCAEAGRGGPVDDIPVGELRAAFDGARAEYGLLLVDGRWHAREKVLAGPRIFGRHRPFVPNASSFEPLWRTLALRQPDAHDCMAVLRELAGAPLDPADTGVVLDTIRALARELGSMSPQLRAHLRWLPLWTGKKWETGRPLYALEDEALAAQVARQISVWQPGFSTIVEFTALLDALGVILVRSEHFTATSFDGRRLTADGELRQQFALAVQHLSDEFARGDQQLYEGLTVGWTNLAAAHVFVDDTLELVAHPHGQRIVVVAEAHFQREPLALIVRSPGSAGLAEAGGRAVASLFPPAHDRQKVAWAWAVMWQRAGAGLLPERIVLSAGATREDEASTEALLRLKEQAGERAGRKRASPGPRPNAETARQGAVRVRKLKNLSLLEPDRGTIVNEGKSAVGVIVPPKRRPTSPSEVREGASPAAGSSGRAKADGRSVLPPVDDRERLALAAVREALRMDPDQINDLRRRRGIGADAVDEFEQFYELKMESSAEVPNEVTLTRAEAERAQDDPDFFLAVVSGLEEGAGELRVRLIFDPLSRLAVRIRGEVSLSGVREVEALDYVFRRRPAQHPGVTQS